VVFITRVKYEPGSQSGSSVKYWCKHAQQPHWRWMKRTIT